MRESKTDEEVSSVIITEWHILTISRIVFTEALIDSCSHIVHGVFLVELVSDTYEDRVMVVVVEHLSN